MSFMETVIRGRTDEQVREKIRNLVLAMMNWKCLKNNEEEKSIQKYRSGCHKSWQRDRSFPIIWTQHH